MATVSEIPAKYLYTLVYFAAALIAEQQEFYTVQQHFELEAYKRLGLANAVDDLIINNKRAVSSKYTG